MSGASSLAGLKNRSEKVIGRADFADFEGQ